MNKSATIINHQNTDRVIEIIIDDSKYIVFTLSYRNLIVIDMTDKEDAILLMNSPFDNRASLSKAIDDIIIMASKAVDDENFISHMDTFIHLNDVSNYDTTAEITAVYKIIVEDHNL